MKTYTLNDEQMWAAIQALMMAVVEIENEIKDMPDDEGLQADLEYFKRHRDDLKKKREEKFWLDKR